MKHSNVIKLIMCAFALIIILVTVSLSIYHSDNLILGLTAQRIITPPPANEESPTPMTTASPTPAATPTATPELQSYDPSAVDLVVGGTALLAIESQSEAERLLNDYLAIMSLAPADPAEWLISCVLPDNLLCTPMSGAVPLRSYDEALSYLLSDPTRLPVTRTVARYEVSDFPVQTTTRSSDALPVGSRIFSMALSERYVVYTETVYVAGLETERLETNRFKLRQGLGALVSIGGYSSRNMRGEPGRNEGEIGRKAEGLSFTAPVKGSIVSYFGFRQGKMHYGIDYKVSSGESVTAPEGGVVIFCGERGEYGLVLDIRHDDTGFISRISGLSSVRVELWQRVNRGQLVGSAPAANACGNVLHYELIVDGVPYNPLQYLGK